MNIPNIDSQLYSLIALLILSFLYYSNNKLRTTNYLVFVHVIIISIFAVIADIAARLTIANSSDNLFITAMCKTYFTFFIMFGCMIFVYCTFNLDKKINIDKMYKVFNIIIGGILLIMFLSPVKTTYENGIAYIHGAASILCFACAILIMTAIAYISYKYKTTLPVRKFNVIYRMIFAWVIILILQIIFPNILLMSVVVTICVYLIYDKIENPNIYINTELQIFNTEGLESVLVEIFDDYKNNKSPLSMYVIKLNFLAKISINTKRKIELDIIQLLNNTVKLHNKIYLLDANTLGVICKDEYDIFEQIDKISPLIHDYCNKKKQLVSDSYIIIPEIDDFQNIDEFYKCCSLPVTTENRRLVITSDVVHNVKQFDKMKNMIDDAITQDRIEVFYQPLYNTNTHKFSSAEALVRMRDKKDNIIMPANFIPVAEETGQIVELGKVIFEKVCQFMYKYDLKSLGIEHISVNLSGAQFDYINPSTYIIDTIKKYDLNASMFNFEITETANTLHENILNNMNNLKHYDNIRFSLDDFGTGLSNIDYCAKFPINTIKFNYEFIKEYSNNNKLKTIMNHMINAAKELEINVVAEGVETEDQLDTVTNLGIKYVQGYYFSYPVCEAEFLDYIQEHNVTEE